MYTIHDLLYQITGVAIEIQKDKGDAHTEKVYHRLLLAELAIAGFEVENHPRLVVKDAYGEPVQTYYPDLRARKSGCQALVELKACKGSFDASDYRQARSYLSVSPDDQAILLLNFGEWPLGKERYYQRRERTNL